MLELLLAGPTAIRIERESTVVAAPPFAGFTPLISADGKTALTAGSDGSLVFWRIAPDGTVSFLDALQLSEEAEAGNQGIAYALGPDGRQFALSTWDGQVEVWDRSTLKRVLHRDLSRPAFFDIAFHPTRPWLLMGGSAGPTRIDLKTGAVVKLAASWPCQPVPNSDLLVSPYGVTDGATGRALRVWKSKQPNDLPMRVSPDGKLVVMAGEDPGWSPPQEAATEAAYARSQTLRTWRISDGKLLRTMPGFWTMSGDDRDIVWLNARQIAVPGLSVVRDAITGKLVRKLPASKSVIERPLNTVLVTLTGPKADRRLALRFPDPGARSAMTGIAVGAVAALHDVRTAFRMPGFTVGGSQALTIVSGAGTKTIPNRGISGGELGVDEKGIYSSEIWGTQGEKGVAVADFLQWPAQYRKEIRLSLFPKGGVPSNSAAQIKDRQEIGKHVPDGYRSIFSVSAVKHRDRFYLVSDLQRQEGIAALSAKTGQELWRAKEEHFQPMSTTVDANDAWVAFEWENSADRKVELCLAKAATGEIVHRIPCSMVYTTKFSPDGRMLAALTTDGVEIVDVSVAHPTLRRLSEGTNPLDGNLSDPRLFWTPSGKLVVTGSLRPMQIYDPISGTLLATQRFYGDGRWLAVRSDGAFDGNATADVRIWRDEQWVASKKRERFFLDLLK